MDSDDLPWGLLPNHNQRARPTTPFQSLPSRRTIRRATTKVMTRVEQSLRAPSLSTVSCRPRSLSLRL
jgi:hypothetical protein